MAQSARHLVEEVFGPRAVRQWVLSFPYPLRFLFASKPDAIGPVLAIVHRVIAGWLADQTGIERARAQYGTVTLIQRFGSALNLNIHFHMLLCSGSLSQSAGPRCPYVLSGDRAIGGCRRPDRTLHQQPAHLGQRCGEAFDFFVGVVERQ